MNECNQKVKKGKKGKKKETEGERKGKEKNNKRNGERSDGVEYVIVHCVSQCRIGELGLGPRFTHQGAASDGPSFTRQR
jgi:hypothetical protein